MTVEAITDLIQEYMYEGLQDSNNSNHGRNVKRVKPFKIRRKQKFRNELTPRPDVQTKQTNITQKKQPPSYLNNLIGSETKSKP